MSCGCSGVCELTNQSRLGGLKETEAKTGIQCQKGFSGGDSLILDVHTGLQQHQKLC